MKLKALVLALLLVVLGSISIGTLAYFTADTTAHNVITSGGVEIELVETTIQDGAEIPFPKEGLTGIMPGVDASKIVKVENTGASAAWIRVKLEKVVTLADGTRGDKLPDGTDAVTYEISNPEMWLTKEGDTEGWYYYKDPVPANQGEDSFTETILETVKFSPKMGNEYQSKSETECTVAEVIVSAQAVQVANNGTDVLTAQGWPEIEG